MSDDHNPDHYPADRAARWRRWLLRIPELRWRRLGRGAGPRPHRLARRLASRRIDRPPRPPPPAALALLATGSPDLVPSLPWERHLGRRNGSSRSSRAWLTRRRRALAG